jgi:translation initiation factor IF-2
MRVHELAKELGVSAKELMETAKDKLGIVFKSHSVSVTQGNVDNIRALYVKPEEKKAKPKAFVVKKAKAEKPEEPVKEEKEPEAPKVSVTRVVKTSTEKPKAPVIEPVKERPRLEIVRPAPKQVEKPKEEAPAPVKPPKREHENRIPDIASLTRKNFGKQPKEETKPAKQDSAKQKDKQQANKTAEVPKAPIKRHIISPDMYANQDFRNKKKKKEKNYKSKEEEQERISLEKAVQSKHKKHVQEVESVEEVKQVVINRPMTVGELADKIRKTPAEIIKFLMMEKIMVTVNSPIDIDTAKRAVINFDIEPLDEDIEAFIQEETEKEEKNKLLLEADEKSLIKRAPVVTIMGHVDHGKTTLLDSIRASKHKIVATEVGGITQSIGAYTVWQDDKKIVFIDTPGHEAFTQMRARGAKSTDIAILVVAADDGVMPQTIEAINHAKSANVPIIVAVNKMDKPDADPDKVLQQMTEYGLVPEAWGGDTICVKVSAIQGKGIDELLEYILLVAEMQELKAVKDCPGMGVIIEANLDKGKGPVATMLVQNGILKVGDSIVVGTVGGKVRALLDDSGQRVKSAGPSTPVEILGLNEVPQAGDAFEVVANEKAMKQIVTERKQQERINRLEAMAVSHVKKETLANDEIKNLNLIIKANTNGSAEAVSQAIQNVKSSQVIPKIMHVGVGDISEADVMLASASDAIILGFSVKEDANALAAAERELVTIKKYDIIYQVLEDVEKTMLSLLEPEIQEVELGTAEVRQIFTFGKTGKIAGCYVLEGKIVRSKTAVVKRGGVEIYKGEINQLKRFKDDVKEVAQGFECGISFAKFNDLQEGDIIEVSTTKEVERSSLV